MWDLYIHSPINQFAGDRDRGDLFCCQSREAQTQLGADHAINYMEDTDWGKTARELTLEGVGVDHTIEVGGVNSLQQSLEAIKFEGVITIIGLLGGEDVMRSIF